MQNESASDSESLRAQVAALEGNLSDLRTSIARVEGEMTSSWAFHTKEEYETRLKNGIKTDLVRYLVTILSAMFAVLAGSGVLFINLVTSAEFEDQYSSMVTGYESKFGKFLEDASVNSEWRALHDHGVLHRYMLNFHKGADLREDDKRRLLIRGFGSATFYFESALKKDVRQASTHWELAHLLYFRPKEFNLPELIDSEKAVEHLESAIRYYREPEIRRGWRADAYSDIFGISLDRWRATKNREERAGLEKAAREAAQLAIRDYENANMLEKADAVKKQLAALEMPAE